ncbi:MAG TPA: ABC transporter family substrate-binding protein [Actinomycetota bacterium]|nr:ABC transporter family substrate-binding protein [Actinomycetota bacterium]
MHRLRTAKLAALLVGVALVAAACGGGDDNGGGGGTSGGSAQITDGGTLNYAADQEPTGFNNNTSKDNGTSVYNIVINMYPQPFHAQPDFTVKMDDAFLDSAEQTSDNPQTVVYKIKPDAVWSDGTPITADDFIYNWKQQNGSIKDNDVASTTGYDQVKSVEGSDNGKTVTVVFKTPFADWKGMFTGLVPAAFVQKQAGGWNTGLDKNPEKIPSGGPFKVDNYTQGQSLTLVRNDKYWGPKAHLDSIVFRFLPESTTQPAALQNNEVDLIYPQPQLDQVQQVKALPDVNSEINFGLSFEHLDFNFKTPGLDDLAVRQAIATGINVQELVDRTVKQFSDKAQPLGNRIWLTGQPQYQDHFGQYGKGDTAAAAKLLEDAGYAKGADGVYAKGGKKLSFRFSTTAGNKLRETQGELFQAQMKDLGIEIKIANVDSTKFFGEWLPNGNFDIADFAWVGTPFAISGSRDIYRTGGGGNYGNYSSKKVDDLFTQANGETDETKSAELGNQIDQQITTDMATIPLYTKPTFIAYRNTFANIHDNATSEGPFNAAVTWGMKTA